MIHQADLFDTASNLKEQGQKKVLDHSGEWRERAIEMIVSLTKSCRVFTAEDLRMLAHGRLDEPHHCNAWGAIMTTACKRGLIVKTGEYVASSFPSSHGRMIAVWKAA